MQASANGAMRVGTAAPTKLRVGEFQLERPLDSWGELYAARRASDGARVALRLLRSPWPHQAALVLERARAARLARHPMLASVLAYGTAEDGSIFVASEVVEGKPLCEWADGIGIPPLHVAVDLMHRICLALQAAHRAGLCHEMLSPASIQVEPGSSEDTERVMGRILDLAIPAAAYPPGVDLFQAQFMAPEQLQRVAGGWTASGGVDARAVDKKQSVAVGV